MEKGGLAEMAVTGARIALRVQPGSRRPGIDREGDGLSVRVAEIPEGGKANAAVIAAVARALGLPPSRLRLVAGARGRAKVVEVL